MSRKQKFINLTDSELKTLREGSKYHPKPEFRIKCQGLLLNHSGMKFKDISNYLEVNINTVGNWVKTWETNGIVGFARKSGQGCKPILSVTNQTHTQVLSKSVDAHSQNVKAIQAELIEALGVSMGVDTVKRFLKKIIILGDALDVVPTKGKIKQSMPINTNVGNYS
jgi:transposase